MAGAVQTITVTNVGGTVSIDPANLADTYYLEMDGGSVTLAANFSIETTGAVPVGSRFNVLVGSGLDLNGKTFSVFGQTYTVNQQAANTLWWYMFQVFDGPALWFYVAPYDFSSSDFIYGDGLIDGTVPLAKLENLTSGRMIVGSAGNIPTAVAMSGDATLSNTGALTIANSAITNVKVDASAAIARTKLATGTADHVVINSNTGAFSSEAQLAPARGGTGQNNSASTGFQLWNAGTSSVTAISEIVTLNVSWNSGYVGDFKIKMPYAGTVTGIYGYITQATVGASAGTCVAKNNAGTTMTAGTITTTAGGDARGTAYSVSPSANNTFAAGDILTFTTATATAGEMQLSITVTRTS